MRCERLKFYPSCGEKSSLRLTHKYEVFGQLFAGEFTWDCFILAPNHFFFFGVGEGGRNTLKKKIFFWSQPMQSLRVACCILHFGQVSLKSLWWLVSHLPGPFMNSVLNARYPVNSPTYKLAYVYLWSVYVGEFVVVHTYSESRVVRSVGKVIEITVH